METPPNSSPPTSTGRRHAITALILFSPAILILLLGTATRGRSDEVFLFLVLAGAGPLIAGTIAGRRWAASMSGSSRPNLGPALFFVPVGIVASFVACFFGCVAGGALR